MSDPKIPGIDKPLGAGFGQGSLNRNDFKQVKRQRGFGKRSVNMNAPQGNDMATLAELFRDAEEREAARERRGERGQGWRPKGFSGGISQSPRNRGGSLNPSLQELTTGPNAFFRTPEQRRQRIAEAHGLAPDAYAGMKFNDIPGQAGYAPHPQSIGAVGPARPVRQWDDVMNLPGGVTAKAQPQGGFGFGGLTPDLSNQLNANTQNYFQGLMPELGDDPAVLAAMLADPDHATNANIARARAENDLFRQLSSLVQAPSNPIDSVVEFDDSGGRITAADRALMAQEDAEPRPTFGPDGLPITPQKTGSQILQDLQNVAPDVSTQDFIAEQLLSQAQGMQSMDQLQALTESVAPDQSNFLWDTFDSSPTPAGAVMDKLAAAQPEHALVQEQLANQLQLIHSIGLPQVTSQHPQLIEFVQKLLGGVDYNTAFNYILRNR